MKSTIIALLLLITPLMAGEAVALDLIFDPPVDYPAGYVPTSVQAGDFDVDGSLDLAVANIDSSTISILINNGSGAFAEPVGYGVGNNTMSVCAGDFDGDSILDLAVANGGSGTVSVLKNNGDGTFADAVDYGPLSNAASICAADFDGDGKLDLAAGYSGDVAVLFNNGDGTFASPVSYGVGFKPSCVVTSDFDRDGTPDLAITKWGVGPDVPSNVSVLINLGDGSFGYAAYYGSWLDPSCVCAADFDGDGNSDLAITHARGMSTLKNNGDGTFADAVDYPIGYNPPSIIACDFDLDGRPDLAVANPVSNAISILPNKGDGTFGDTTNYMDTGYPYSLFAADFNGDGKTDLAVANCSANSVSVLINCSSIPNDANEPSQSIVSEDFQLHQNRPNPFNPVTTIEYSLPRASHVTITIYDILGQAIKALVSQRQEAGFHSVKWDGKDRNGRPVSSGIYFYCLRAGDFVKSKKMVLTK